ncbi:tapasin-related protein-like [Esox lucius]|uniref:Ig-like domain-containing protein n=1 Tax=Esox lucius TaxID=8010 RepID=A0A6Q2XKH5_ESOLU|nr:tapasin-related protein-like [Esox lucius]
MNIFAILCFILHTGVQGFLQEQWLPCRLWDVHVWKKNDGQTESKYVQKDVVLQFASSGDSALYPDSITFLVGASKVDMRKYVEGPVDQLRCEIHRYSKGMSRVRWPSLGGTEHDIWFTCTLRHIAGLFNITSYLRVTPATTMSPHQPDFHSWVTLAGKDKLRASAVMVLMTRSPSVWVGLQEKETLHCEFAVDHKVPDLTVEWHLDPFRGRRTRLFRYSRRSGQTEGSGVAVNGIARGTASLTVPLTGRSSEGTYWCSVQVPPLNGSLAIGLHIMVPPSVSMTIEQSLIPRVVCKADRYYPLDVDIELFKETGSGELPKKLGNVSHYKHTEHSEGTFSLSAFVRLRPSPLESECGIYSCRVKHVSLPGLYIHKSKTDPGCWTWIHLTSPGLICLFAVIIIFTAVARRCY